MRLRLLRWLAWLGLRLLRWLPWIERWLLLNLTVRLKIFMVIVRRSIRIVLWLWYRFFGFLYCLREDLHLFRKNLNLFLLLAMLLSALLSSCEPWSSWWSRGLIMG